MGKGDVKRAYQFSSNSKIVGIHIESVSHTMLTRKELRNFINEQKLDKRRVSVREDGQRYMF